VRSRRTIRPPDLTSLVDVMFILVFAALIRSAAIEPAESAPAPPPAPLPEPGPPAPPPTYTAVRDQAMATLRADLEARPAVVARVSKDGVLTALELADRTIARGLPLLERVADANVALAYLGDRSPELRICKVVARDLGVTRLDDQIVAITPDVPIADLPVALVAGLRTDVERCLVDTGAIGVLVDATPEDHDRPSP
jgi:hypothetical protein